MTTSYRDELNLTNYLIDRLERRLAGREDTICLDKTPSDRYHLGVLKPCGLPAFAGSQTTSDDSDEDRDYAIDDDLRQSAALGIDLKVLPDRTDSIEISVTPQFALYLRHLPTFAEQRTFAGEAAAGDHQGDHYVAIREKYVRYPVCVPEIRLTLPAGERSQLTIRDPIQVQVADTLHEACADHTLWRAFRRRTDVPRRALRTEAAYHAYLADATTAPGVPPFAVLLDVRAAPTTDGGLRVSAFVVNATEVGNTAVETARRCLVDAQLGVHVTDGTLVPVELVAIPEDYQYDRRVWAVGHGASVEVDADNSRIRTRALARYRQPRLETTSTPPARFDDLADRPCEVLGAIHQAMCAYARDWADGLDSGRLVHELHLTDDQTRVCRRDLAHFEREVERFDAGMQALAADRRLLEAFVATNRVFARIGAEKGFDRWYTFQVCFIVSQLPALAVREGVVESDTLDWADVLWFPTGGGKTEAYLGLIVYAALYDRLRGKRSGVTAWLRFPLRMLSVQQLHRAVRVLWEAELERRHLPGYRPGEGDPISLGYFVGQRSTPNSLAEQPYNRWRLSEIAASPALREQVQVVADCPNCGETGTTGIRVDQARRRIRHVCGDCLLELPIYVSDEEIYRFIPTVIVGTLDKVATVAYQSRFSALWGGVQWRCPQPEHGYGLGRFCPVFGCDADEADRIPVTPYDAAPTLCIQDELHLLREELGAFTGHYETLVRYCAEQVGGLPPKMLAATATIEGVDHQTRHLYGLPARRFPERGYQRWESFYTGVARDGDASTPMIGRQFLAFRSHYMRPSEASLLCLRILYDEVRRLYRDPNKAVEMVGLQDATAEKDVRGLLSLYDTTLTYVGSKGAGTHIEKALDEEVGRRLPQAGRRDLVAAFLSGQSSLSDIHQTIVRLEEPPDWDDADRLDALVATSLISHGVDVARVNLMVMCGMPGRVAEYIQAASRSGRRHVGLVVTVFSRWSARDQSIYHRFVEHHRSLDRLVAPVPINRFAKFIVRRTLPGIVAGLVMGRYVPDVANHGIKRTYLLLAALDGRAPFTPRQQIAEGQLLRDVLAAYHLGTGAYDPGLEAAMRAEIERELRRQVRRLRTSDAKYIFNALTRSPMRSLRDVDRAVAFAADPTQAGWERLRWLDRQGKMA